MRWILNVEIDIRKVHDALSPGFVCSINKFTLSQQPWMGLYFHSLYNVKCFNLLPRFLTVTCGDIGSKVMLTNSKLRRLGKKELVFLVHSGRSCACPVPTGDLEFEPFQNRKQFTLNVAPCFSWQKISDLGISHVSWIFGITLRQRDIKMGRRTCSTLWNNPSVVII
jgi:hypothetical protein